MVWQESAPTLRYRRSGEGGHRGIAGQMHGGSSDGHADRRQQALAYLLSVHLECTVMVLCRQGEVKSTRLLSGWQYEELEVIREASLLLLM